jgi:hypothetical protein
LKVVKKDFFLYCFVSWAKGKWERIETTRAPMDLGPKEISPQGRAERAEILYIFRKIFFFPTFQCLRLVQIISSIGSSQPYLLPSPAPFSPCAANLS